MLGQAQPKHFSSGWLQCFFTLAARRSQTKLSITFISTLGLPWFRHHEDQKKIKNIFFLFLQLLRIVLCRMHIQWRDWKKCQCCSSSSELQWRNEEIKRGINVEVLDSAMNMNWNSCPKENQWLWCNYSQIINTFNDDTK